MKITWNKETPEYEYSAYYGVDAEGNSYYRNNQGDVFLCTIPDGRCAAGRGVEEAYSKAKSLPEVNSAEKIRLKGEIVDIQNNIDSRKRELHQLDIILEESRIKLERACYNGLTRSEYVKNIKGNKLIAGQIELEYGRTFDNKMSAVKKTGNVTLELVGSMYRGETSCNLTLRYEHRTESPWGIPNKYKKDVMEMQQAIWDAQI